jgi:hypothetical protein
MGFVQIPPTPSGPRFTAIRAELSEDELRTVVRHMRSALEHALEPNPSAALVRPSNPINQPSLVASARSRRSVTTRGACAELSSLARQPYPTPVQCVSERPANPTRRLCPGA